MRIGHLIIPNLAERRLPAEKAKSLQISRTTVCQVARRFWEAGEAGLVDRRDENGQAKLDDDYLGLLYEMVASNPWSMAGGVLNGIPRNLATRCASIMS